MAALVSLASPTRSNLSGVTIGPQHHELSAGQEGRIESSRRTSSRPVFRLQRGLHPFDGMTQKEQQEYSPMKPSRYMGSPRKPRRSVDDDYDLHSPTENLDHDRRPDQCDNINTKLELPRIPAITISPRTRNNALTDSPKKPTRSVDVDTLPRIPSRIHSRRDLRRVRFDDSEEAIVSSTFVYPGVEEELFPCLYYSKREISDIRMANKQRAMSIEASNRSIVSSIHHLYGVATHVDMPEMSDRDAADRLVQSGARGLEHFLTPRFGKQREWAVHMILKVQDEHQGSDDVEELLRKWSETLSSSSCHYARNVAMIDAREAIRESMRSSASSSRSI